MNVTHLSIRRLLIPAATAVSLLASAPAAALDNLKILVPAAPGRLEAYPVSTLVNNVKNNGPELVEPLAPEPQLPA